MMKSGERAQWNSMIAYLISDLTVDFHSFRPGWMSVSLSSNDEVAMHLVDSAAGMGRRAERRGIVWRG
jgi:hypothetical protein